MSFADALRAGRFAVTLEITPPKEPLPRVLLRRAGLLGRRAQAMNVIQRPDRQSSLEASLTLRAAGLDPVWHLVNRGRSRAEIAAGIDAATAGGIRQALCLRGDHPADDTEATPSIREVVARVRAAMPDALIGVTLNQYTPDRHAALRNLRAKLAAGADYVQTQPVFSAEDLRPVVEAVRSVGPPARIVAMVMPLLSAEAAAAITARLRIALPERLARELAARGADAGWRAFDETVAALAAPRLVDGVAVMTFEMDPAPAIGRRIAASLAAAGIGAGMDEVE